MSGTFESLVYDELVLRDAADRYPSLIGWANSTAMLANLAATVLAAPLLVAGGYQLVGWVSVAICGGQALLAATLPVSHGGAPPGPRVSARRDRARRDALPRDAPRRARGVAAPSRRTPGPAARRRDGRPDGVRRVLPAGGAGARRGPPPTSRCCWRSRSSARRSVPPWSAAPRDCRHAQSVAWWRWVRSWSRSVPWSRRTPGSWAIGDRLRDAQQRHARGRDPAPGRDHRPGPGHRDQRPGPAGGGGRAARVRGVRRRARTCSASRRWWRCWPSRCSLVAAAVARHLPPAGRVREDSSVEVPPS